MMKYSEETKEIMVMTKIRQARLDEKNLLTNLTLESKSYWGYSSAFLEKCRPHLTMTEDYIKNWPVKVFEKNGEVIAYFSLKKIGEENRLDNLWVRPKYIKSGIGKVLFKEAISVAKEIGWTFFTLVGEEKAIGFYEKQGARLIGKIQSRLGEDIFLPHMKYVFKSYSYNEINLKSFERIWNSAHYDNFIDSWEKPFIETEECKWKPVYEKWLKVMREVCLTGKPIGYIFLSPKSDGSAHLGYGLYSEFRGRGLMIGIVNDFLKETIPTLDSEVKWLIGTTLKENHQSQKLLKKLKFSFYKDIIEEHNDVKINYHQYKRDL